MEDRTRYEAEQFRRVESRLVAVEIRTEALQATLDHYVPIVDKLKDADTIAAAVAERVKAAQTVTFTRVQLGLAAAALLVPPMLSAGITIFVLKG